MPSGECNTNLFFSLPLPTVPMRRVPAEVQDALLSPSPSEDQTEGREPMGSAASEALPASNSAPLSFVSVQDVIETVAVKAEPNAESRCASRFTSASVPSCFSLVAVVVTIVVSGAGQ